jgi:hypothetical protein
MATVAKRLQTQVYRRLFTAVLPGTRRQQLSFIEKLAERVSAHIRYACLKLLRYSVCLFYYPHLGPHQGAEFERTMTYDLASTSSAESLTENPRVGGSIPPLGTTVSLG